MFGIFRTKNSSQWKALPDNNSLNLIWFIYSIYIRPILQNVYYPRPEDILSSGFVFLRIPSGSNLRPPDYELPIALYFLLWCRYFFNNKSCKLYFLLITSMSTGLVIPSIFPVSENCQIVQFDLSLIFGEFSP